MSYNVYFSIFPSSSPSRPRSATPVVLAASPAHPQVAVQPMPPSSPSWPCLACLDPKLLLGAMWRTSMCFAMH